MNESHPNNRRASFWPLWIFIILVSPWYPIWVSLSHPDGSGWPPILVAYLIILAVSFVVVEPRAEARRGSWEWFVETVERGVPLSILGAIASAGIGFAALIAFVNAFMVG